MSKPIIIAVTGLPSAGKGTFSEIAVEYGFKRIIMGDVIRNEVANRGLEVNRENSNRIMIELRKEHGKDVVAKFTVKWIEDALNKGENMIMIDGVRSLSEMTLFRKYFPHVEVIAIHASPIERYKRSLKRKRKDDAYDMDGFNRRDLLELSVGIGNVIATADYLVDSSSGYDNTIAKMKELLNELINSK